MRLRPVLAVAALVVLGLLGIGPSQAAVGPPLGWPFLFKIPQQPSFLGAFDVDVGPDGSLWVADSDHNQIVNFDPADPGGELRIGSGTGGSGDGEFKLPSALAADARGDVYVADSGNSRVQKFTSDGDFVMTWGSLGSGDGQFVVPTGIAVDPLGSVYVTDLGNDRVQKFTPDGVFVTKWGSHGSGDGQFSFRKVCARFGCGSLAAGIAVDAVGHVYVADSGNGRVQRFTSDGAFLAQFSAASPEGLAIDADGNVYAGSFLRGRVEKYTSDGAFVTAWSELAAEGIAVAPQGEVYVADGIIEKFTSEGRFLERYTSFGAAVRFRSPNGVAVDSAGNVYVADTGKPDTATGTSARVARFTGDGTFIGQFGSPGLADGLFTAPAFVSLDSAGHIYVVDRDARRVQKFASDGTFLAQMVDAELPFRPCARRHGQRVPDGRVRGPHPEILERRHAPHRVGPSRAGAAPAPFSVQPAATAAGRTAAASAPASGRAAAASATRRTAAASAPASGRAAATAPDLPAAAPLRAVRSGRRRFGDRVRRRDRYRQGPDVHAGGGLPR